MIEGDNNQHFSIQTDLVDPGHTSVCAPYEFEIFGDSRKVEAYLYLDQTRQWARHEPTAFFVKQFSIKGLRDLEFGIPITWPVPLGAFSITSIRIPLLAGKYTLQLAVACAGPLCMKAEFIFKTVPVDIAE